MTAAGIRRPRILLSGSAEFLLSGDELRTALSHEIAHIQRRDNFKKLLLHFVAFPGMQMLEGSWLQACEMAADLAAVSSTGEALDLAAALIKVSRLKPTEPSPDLTAALVHGHTAMLNARVERLLSWSEEPPIPFGVSAWRCFLGVAGIVIVCAFSYSSLLAGVHTITEWLMR